MTAKTSVPKILHLHSTFAPGGKELRAVQLMNAFGKELEHSVVSGMPDQMGARDHLAKRVPVQFPEGFPALTGLPTPGRLIAIAQFNEDEADGLSAKRNWFRRIALGRTHRLVVPSQTLEAVALNAWSQPRAKVARISNGIATKKFTGKAKPAALRVVKRQGERWVGTLAGLRPVKQLSQLVQACEKLPEDWHLVILGEGPDRDRILEAAADLELSHRVHLPGAVTEPEKVIGMFDIFALSSKSEQFPLSVVEAMAAGLPVAAPNVGDIRAILSEPNRALIAAPNDPRSLAASLEKLAADADLREELGGANRKRATENFDEAGMIAAYRALYWGALETDE